MPVLNYAKLYDESEPMSVEELEEILDREFAERTGREAQIAERLAAAIMQRKRDEERKARENSVEEKRKRRLTAHIDPIGRKHISVDANFWHHVETLDQPFCDFDLRTTRQYVEYWVKEHYDEER